MGEFKKHFCTKTHNVITLTDEVREWLPFPCKNKGCKMRYIKQSKLHAHQIQCDKSKNRDQLQDLQRQLQLNETIRSSRDRPRETPMQDKPTPINEERPTRETTSDNRTHEQSQGDTHISKFEYFQGNEWDEAMTLWRGTTMQNIPAGCVNEFREIVCETAKEAKTGQIEAIRAFKMLTRLILHTTNGRRNKKHKTVLARIKLWQQRKYAELCTELREYEWDKCRNSVRHEKDREQSKERAMYKKVEQAELHYAMMAAMSEGVNTGPSQRVQDLFVLNRKEDELLIQMNDLPDTTHPDVSPEIFWMTIAERKRGGAQAADGWRMDHIKDINIKPDEEGDNDPLRHFREYCVDYASGRLPVNEETYRILAGGK
jgi:hypothetical protein